MLLEYEERKILFFGYKIDRSILDYLSKIVLALGWSKVYIPYLIHVAFDANIELINDARNEH